MCLTPTVASHTKVVHFVSVFGILSVFFENPKLNEMFWIVWPAED